jgi:ATP-binding cassette subfamily F protein 3
MAAGQRYTGPVQVRCSNISLAFGGRPVLSQVNILLTTDGDAPSSRAALAGVNGSGKSTLLKIIAGIREPDSGERSAGKGCRISYLPQWGIVFTGRTLREEAESAYRSIAELLTVMEHIGRRLEGSGEDNKTTTTLVEEYHRLQQTVEESGYYRREETLDRVLGGLGFSRADADRPCGSFSGGWQMRIALAKVLLENPDVMLLDEPTNYLDIEARTWLEAWLMHFSGAYLLVSHDRYFLDLCVREVYEISRGTLKRYAGNYSFYETSREAEAERLLARYREQQEEIKRTEALIRRFRYKASKAAMVQERLRKLEKMERIDIPESPQGITLAFPPPPRAGRVVLTLRGAGKRYGERPVLAGLDLTLERGERLVVAGRNGAGKSTLLRIIAGTGGAYEGTVLYGTGVTPGYFSQDTAETITGGSRVLDFLAEEAPAAAVPRLRDMLGAFLFRGDDVYKPLEVLSGGEKSRLALLRLLLRPVNLLVLDEPTNHLDLASKDLLGKALLAWGGTAVFVSHDRGFMETLSTKTLELRPPEPGASGASAARLFYGGYGYYAERLEREKAGMEIPPPEDGKGRTRPEPPDPAAAAPAAPPSAEESRRETKRRQTLIRRLERREEALVETLERLEKEQARLEQELARPEVYGLRERALPVKEALDLILAEAAEAAAAWEQAAAEKEAALHPGQGTPR